MTCRTEPLSGDLTQICGAADGIEAGPAAWISVAAEERVRYGVGVGAAGDVNGDGADDVFVLALPYYPLLDLRQAFVYFGAKHEEAATTSAGETGTGGAGGSDGSDDEGGFFDPPDCQCRAAERG